VAYGVCLTGIVTTLLLGLLGVGEGGLVGVGVGALMRIFGFVLDSSDEEYVALTDAELLTDWLAFRLSILKRICMLAGAELLLTLGLKLSGAPSIGRGVIDFGFIFTLQCAMRDCWSFCGFVVLLFISKFA
jgi:hypothetical protein